MSYRSPYVSAFKKHFDLFSQAGQDLFVIAMSQDKHNGTYLEIGAGIPVSCNNTFLLARDFNWTGLSIDDGATWKDLPNQWNKDRPNSNFVIADALLYDYSNSISHIDYLQIDIDPPVNNLNMLNKLVNQIRFSIITFEHDICKNTEDTILVREQSRQLLQQHGYEMVVSDVAIPPNLVDGATTICIEDWYVDPAIVPRDVIDAYKNVTDSLIPKYWYDIFLLTD